MDLAKMSTVVALPLPLPLPLSTASLPLSISAAALRHFQLLFALGSHLLFDRIFNHFNQRGTTLEVQSGIRVAVSLMNLITLIYAAITISGVYLSHRLPSSKRYGLELLSVVADILVAILFLVKGAILNSTRLDCEVLLEEKFLDRGTVNQQITSLVKRVFGPFGIDDIDRQCAGSLFIYWISLVAILSYTMSILVTLVRLRDYRRLLLNHDKKVDATGHVEMTIEVPSPTAVQRISSSSSFRSPGFPAEGFSRQEKHDFLLPIIHRPRSSQETTSSLSSYGSEANAVADGFRPLDDLLPQYTSRPASLHSAKGDSVKGD